MSELSNKNHRNKNSGKYWLFKISSITLVLTYILGRFSDVFVRNFDNIIVALLAIMVIIFIGVIFDIIGIAVATVDNVPFLSMASKKVKGANNALVLIRNASQVSSFCNDVIGDICGILSGSAGTILVSKLLISGKHLDATVIGLIISSIIAALTVGGKAFGKDFAIQNNQKIVLAVGYILSILTRDDSASGKKKKRKE